MTLWHVGFLSTFSAAMSATQVLQPHGEPTPPPRKARDGGAGQGLAHLPFVAQATRPLLPFHAPGLHRLGAQPSHHMFQPGCASEGADCHPCEPPPCIVFFHLPLGQAVGPAQEETSGPAGGAVVGSRLPTAKGCEEGRRIACVGLRAERRQRPRAEPLLGVMSKALMCSCGCAPRRGATTGIRH